MKKKVLVTSLLTIALCISVICGATLAIFTSNNTTKIDINSANVETESTVKFVGYKTLGQEWVTEVDEKNIEFDSKDPITASIDESGNISMNNLRAGDKARIELKVTNKSNISINYHMTLTADNAAVWTDLSVAVKEGGTEVTLGTDPANNLIKGTDWKNVGAVNGAESADLAAYEIEIGFDDAFAGGSVDNYSLTINTVAQQGNAPTTNFIGSADRVEDLVEQGYVEIKDENGQETLLNAINSTVGSEEAAQVVLSDDLVLSAVNSPDTEIFANESNGLIDANGHTLTFDCLNEGWTNFYVHGELEIRNARIVIKGNSPGITGGKLSFYNCIIENMHLYLEPTQDIAIKGCTLIDTSFDIVYYESAATNPKDIIVTIKDNSFNLNNRRSAMGFYMSENSYGDAFDFIKGEYWENLIVEGNTFYGPDDKEGFTAFGISTIGDDDNGNPRVYDDTLDISYLTTNNMIVGGNAFAKTCNVLHRDETTVKIEL